MQGDSGIIFYNQPKSSSGVATLMLSVQVGNTKVHKINFDISKVPQGITKIAINNDRIYTCVPGILHNTPDGVIINPLEFYSAPNSENGPKLRMGPSNMVEVIMDKGPINDYK